MVARAIFISAVAFRVNRERGPCATSPPTSSIGGEVVTQKSYRAIGLPMAPVAVAMPENRTAPAAAPATTPVAAVGRVGRIIGWCIVAVVTWIVAVIAAIVRRGDCSAD